MIAEAPATRRNADAGNGPTTSGTAVRLALLVPELAVGGAERAIVFLANELSRGGYRVDLIVVDPDGPLREHVSPLVRLLPLGSRRMLTGVPPLVRYLRDARPHALLSTLTYANIVTVWAARLARTGVRVLLREATTLSRNRDGGLKDRVVHRMASSAYGAADLVIAVSTGVADDLVENFAVPRERIRVIYNPAIPANAAELMRAEAPHPWFTGNGAAPGGQPAVVLAVGRMTDAKDYPNLIEAFASVRAKRPARLVILGDGELRGRLEQLVTERGLGEDVSLPGFVDNPFAYMARASVFVLSSKFEGMPNVLIQAMASGCPVVATDCKSGPREVLDDGRYGKLVPTGNPLALAVAVEAALNGARPEGDPAERAQRFTVERIGREYLDAML